MHNQQLLAREVRVSVEVLLLFQTAAGVLAPKGAESPEQLSPDLLNSQTFPFKIPTLLFFLSSFPFFFFFLLHFSRSLLAAPQGAPRLLVPISP